MSRHVERLQDELLILEFRAGNTAALEKLVRRWQKRIYWFVLTLIRDETAVWDVSQEVWMDAVGSLQKRKAINNFPAWIYRLARNKAISHLRKKNRLNDHQEDLTGESAGPIQETAEALESAENARLIQECLKELPLPQREALTLFYLDDLTLDEIARVLEVPLGTVQSRLHYGRMKIKQLLLQKGFGDERQ
jgi:RNA polymerase sigma-70 factor (ECF subfamily)